jgi:hypothetical protein
MRAYAVFKNGRAFGDYHLRVWIIVTLFALRLKCFLPASPNEIGRRRIFMYDAEVDDLEH